MSPAVNTVAVPTAGPIAPVATDGRDVLPASDIHKVSKRPTDEFEGLTHPVGRPTSGQTLLGRVALISRIQATNMMLWSLVIVGAAVLPSATVDAQKDCSRNQPGPAVSCRLIAGDQQRVIQTGYVDACAAPLEAGCACPDAPSCAMPAEPVACHAVPTCAAPVTNGCVAPRGPCGCSDAGTHAGCGYSSVSSCQCGDGVCRCGRDDCPCGCDESCFDRCRNRCAWSRAHTTGDMYPHFPYYPQDHGYYYFRPYNDQHVFAHMSQVMMLGGDPQNPYSTSMFEAIYEEHYKQNPPPAEPPAGSVKPIGSSLPMLEDLLPPSPRN